MRYAICAGVLAALCLGQAPHWTPFGLTFAAGADVLAHNGAHLYMGGNFASVNGLPAGSVARWNKNTGNWHALGNSAATVLGVNGRVHAIGFLGPHVYVGGTFTGYLGPGGTLSGLARWNQLSPQQEWSTVPFNGVIRQMLPFTTSVGQQVLVFAGTFASGFQGPAEANVTAWAGSSWVRLSSLGSPAAQVAECVVVHGGELYSGGSQGVQRLASGTWTNAGNVFLGSVLHLCSRAGQLFAATSVDVYRSTTPGSWTPLGYPGQEITSMVTYDDGHPLGPAVVATDRTTKLVWRLDPQSGAWAALGNMFSGDVCELFVATESLTNGQPVQGGRSILYAAGGFLSNASGTFLGNVARLHISNNASLVGTQGDFELWTGVQAAPEPVDDYKIAGTSTVLTVELSSPQGTRVGWFPVLAASTLPFSPPILPHLHLEFFTFIPLYVPPPIGPLQGGALPPGGLHLAYVLPTGTGGVIWRVQGALVNPFFVNDVLLSNAHTIQLPQ